MTFDFDIIANIQIKYIREKINELHQYIYNSCEIIAKQSSTLDIEFWHKLAKDKAVFEVLAFATNIPVTPSEYWNSVEFMNKSTKLFIYNRQYAQYRIKVNRVRDWMNKLFAERSSNNTL